MEDKPSLFLIVYHHGFVKNMLKVNIVLSIVWMIVFIGRKTLERILKHGRNQNHFK